MLSNVEPEATSGPGHAFQVEWVGEGLLPFAQLQNFCKTFPAILRQIQKQQVLPSLPRSLLRPSRLLALGPTPTTLGSTPIRAFGVRTYPYHPR